MGYVFRKRDVLLVVAIALSVVVVFALGFIVGAHSDIFSKNETEPDGSAARSGLFFDDGGADGGAGGVDGVGGVGGADGGSADVVGESAVSNMNGATQGVPDGSYSDSNNSPDDGSHSDGNDSPYGGNATPAGVGSGADTSADPSPSGADADDDDQPPSADGAPVGSDSGGSRFDSEAIRQSVHLDVPSYDQRALGYPLGCELVSLAMMMNYSTTVDIRDLEADLPHADHPDEGFRGDPASSTQGWTIFPPALADMMIKYLGSSYDMSNLEMDDLRTQLNRDTPILVWISGLGWPVHALCLSGYDPDGFYYNDPWTGEKDAFLSYDDFYAIWNKPIYDRVLDLTYAPRKALSYYP